MRCPSRSRPGRRLKMSSRDAGFSVLELTVALGLTLLVTSAATTLAGRTEGAVQAQPEAVDAQQRLRAAVDTLTKDFKMAGAGVYAGTGTGPLLGAFAPVLPRKVGLSGDAFSVARADA